MSVLEEHPEVEFTRGDLADHMPGMPDVEDSMFYEAMNCARQFALDAGGFIPWAVPARGFTYVFTRQRDLVVDATLHSAKIELGVGRGVSQHATQLQLWTPSKLSDRRMRDRLLRKLDSRQQLVEILNHDWRIDIDDMIEERRDDRCEARDSVGP